MGVVERSAGCLKSLFLGVQDGGGRIPFADNVKGLAIVLVVAGHWLSHYTDLEGGMGLLSFTGSYTASTCLRLLLLRAIWQKGTAGLRKGFAPQHG